jgi:hypothetical protein
LSRSIFSSPLRTRPTVLDKPRNCQRFVGDHSMTKCPCQ